MAWISRLTLISYVLGGWLMPALHFHAHHEGGSACLHVTAGESGSNSEAAGHHPGCDHSHHHGQTSLAKEHACDESPEHLSDQYFSKAPPLRFCNGLCALCAARSLASTTLEQTATSVGLNNAPSLVQLTEPTLPTDSVSRLHLSRGPPWIA